MSQDQTAIDVVIFDFGGVLIVWDRRHLFRKLFDDTEQMEWFLSEVCSEEWNRELDRGLPYEKAIAERQEKFPDFADHIYAYWSRWEEMAPGPIEGTAEIVEELRTSGMRLGGLTNFSADTFPRAQAKFPILTTFDDVVVSGIEKIIKPQAEIYELASLRFGVPPERCLFIDDREDNVEGARRVGMDAVRFIDAAKLRGELEERGLLESR